LKLHNNIIIRADASVSIGSGHVMRCLTLAEELRDAGAVVSFVSRVHPGNLNGLIRDKGFQCFESPEAPAPGSNKQNGQDARSEYASWLGVSQQQDAQETIVALGGTRADWLIVDHYGLDKEWERLMRPHVNKIMVIDDLADRRHDCDLLLDQNFFSDGQKRYDDLVPPPCTKLLGPKYALLRREFREARKNLRERTGEVKRVLVFFGGSDPENITGLAIEVLSDAELLHLQVDVVIGAQNPNREGVQKLVQDRPGTTLHVQTSNMAELMCEADLAIGAGGSTTWERCCMGLPSLIIPIAENQIEIAIGIQEAGCATIINDNKNVSEFVQAIHNAISPAVRLKMLSKALCITDGSGVKRVCEKMEIAA
jgi:UDP-2,4-diacetamido-2,4,6-trideoxy-beta-L-altropyranose hydrolase